MFFRMVYKSGQIFLPFCHNTRVWQTDRQTDGQTEFSSQYRVCITCRVVKMIECCCKCWLKFCTDVSNSNVCINVYYRLYYVYKNEFKTFL